MQTFEFFFLFGGLKCTLNSCILYKVLTRKDKKTRCLCHILFVRKWVEQLKQVIFRDEVFSKSGRQSSLDKGEQLRQVIFRDGVFSKSGRQSSSDKGERLNSKLHILRH